MLDASGTEAVYRGVDPTPPRSLPRCAVTGLLRAELLGARSSTHSCLTRSRRELVMTLTEDSAMAAAIMGDRSHPEAG